MSASTYLKIVFFMWNVGVIDTFTAIQFVCNSGFQYSAIVIAALTESNHTMLPKLLPKLLLEPIAGFGLSAKYIMAAETVIERRARAGVILAMLSCSGALAAGSNFATNAAAGAMIYSHMGHMRKELEIRGGATILEKLKSSKIVLSPLKSEISKINPSYLEFFKRLESCEKNKMIIQTMFEQQKINRYRSFLQRKPTVLFNSMESIKSIKANKKDLVKTILLRLCTLSNKNLKTILVTVYIVCGVGVIIFTSVSALYLFQHFKRKRNSRIKNIILDTAVILDKI